MLKSKDKAASPYVFLNMPDIAKETLQQAQCTIDNLKNTRPIDIVLLIGIGGSSLGTQAIYTALAHHLPHGAPQLWCADTIDPVTTHTMVNNLTQALDTKKNVVLVIVSKSGTTLETCANAALYLELLRTHDIDTTRHVIIITNKGSALEHYAQQENITHTFIPTSLGGRFSVFSAVGIVPLMLLGMPVAKLLHGACTANLLPSNDVHDMYLQTATLAASYDAGFFIHDTFVIAPHLMAYGAWYRQLLAESLGKCDNTHGAQRRVGMIPTVSCIANDLHSMAQLYLAGPQRTITTFMDISCGDLLNPSTMTIPNSNCSKLVQHLPSQPVDNIHRALCTGIYTAYREAQLPHLTITSSTCTAETFGYIMQQHMIMVTLLGHLWNINPFDQPQVEDYKKITHKFLS